MRPYQSGQLYDWHRRHWPVGSIYRYHHGQHDLVVAAESPDYLTITFYRDEPVELAAGCFEDVLVVLHRFPGQDWKGTFCNWHRLSGADRDLTLGEQDDCNLCVTLIESPSGYVRASRVVRIDCQFCSFLLDTLAAQQHLPWVGEGVFQSQVNRLITRSSLEQLAQQCPVRCVGEQ